jgi:hypothetical protein
MALKKIINSLDDVAEAFRGEYKARGNKFVLDIEGDDDNTALRNAKDREKERADEEAALRRDAEKALREAQRELGDLKASPEVENLKKELEKERGEKTKLFDGLKQTAAETKALEMATKIAKAPKLLSRFIQERLDVDIVDGKPVVKAKKADGTVADDFSFDALEKEFASSPDFKDIILATKSSGSGAPRSNDFSGGAQSNTDQKPVDLSTVKPTDLVARIAARKEAGA